MKSLVCIGGECIAYIYNSIAVWVGGNNMRGAVIVDKLN